MFIFPRILKNFFPDSSVWLIVPLTVVSKAVFSARVEFCELLVNSLPSGIHHFLGLGIAKKPGKIWWNWNWTGISDTQNYNTRSGSMNNLVPGSEAAGALSWEGIHNNKQEEFSKCQNFAWGKPYSQYSFWQYSTCSSSQVFLCVFYTHFPNLFTVSKIRKDKGTILFVALCLLGKFWLMWLQMSFWPLVQVPGCLDSISQLNYQKFKPDMKAVLLADCHR